MTNSYLHNLEQKQSCITHGSLLAAVDRCSVKITQLKMSGNPELSQLDLKNLMGLRELIKKKLPILSSKRKQNSICVPCETKCPKCYQEFSQLEIMSHIFYCPSALQMMHVQPINAGIAEYNLTLNLYCLLCKFTINNYDSLQVHSSHEIHKTKINESSKIVDTSLIFCALCQEYIANKLLTYEKHITSRLHRIMKGMSPQDWMEHEIYYIGFKNKLRCLKCKQNFPVSQFLPHQHEIDISKKVIFSATNQMTMSLFDFRNQPRVKVYHPSYQCPICLQVSEIKHHFPTCFSVCMIYGESNPQTCGSFSGAPPSFGSMSNLPLYPHVQVSFPIAPPTPKLVLTTSDPLGEYKVTTNAYPGAYPTFRSWEVTNYFDHEIKDQAINQQNEHRPNIVTPTENERKCLIM